MDKLIKIRYLYQVNQDEVAAYLGISRSTITMCENNKRTFPDEANERLRLMNYCWENNQNTESRIHLNLVLDVVVSHSKLIYKERIQECQDQVNELLPVREEIVKEYEIYQNRFRALVTIKSRLREKEIGYGELEQNWFDYNTSKAKKGIVAVGKELAAIDYKISSLEFEIERLKGMV